MKSFGVFTVSVFGFAMLMTSSIVSASVLPPTYESTGSVFSVPAISNWETTGMSMNGMEITVNLGSTTEDVAIWSNGEAIGGTGWTLTMTPATGTTMWFGFTLTVTDTDLEISSLTLNGILGETVFDVDPHIDGEINPSTGLLYSTTGSLDGKPIASDYTDWAGQPSVQTIGIDVQAIYTTPVALNGQNLVGDLFGTLTLNFYNNSITPGASGFTSDNSLYFVTDTDTIDWSPVPEPATLFLFGIGVTGFLGSRIKKRLTVKN